MPDNVEQKGSFSIVLLLGKSNPKELSINLGDLKDIGSRGLHYELPAGTTITLGSLKDFIDWLNEKTGLSIPTSAGGNWPSALQSIYDGGLAWVVTVTRLEIKQAPKPAGGGDAPPLEIHLTVTASAPADHIPSFGPFAVKGFAVGFDREAAPPPTTTPAPTTTAAPKTKDTSAGKN